MNEAENMPRVGTEISPKARATITGRRKKESTMLDRLPYELTKGVTATREGLEINADCPMLLFVMLNEIGFKKRSGSFASHLVPWLDAARLLRYREGEPWCAPYTL